MNSIFLRTLKFAILFYKQILRVLQINKKIKHYYVLLKLFVNASRFLRHLYITVLAGLHHHKYLRSHFHRFSPSIPKTEKSHQPTPTAHLSLSGGGAATSAVRRDQRGCAWATPSRPHPAAFDRFCPVVPHARGGRQPAPRPRGEGVRRAAAAAAAAAAGLGNREPDLRGNVPGAAGKRWVWGWLWVDGVVVRSGWRLVMLFSFAAKKFDVSHNRFQWSVAFTFLCEIF